MLQQQQVAAMVGLFDDFASQVPCYMLAVRRTVPLIYLSFTINDSFGEAFQTNLTCICYNDSVAVEITQFYDGVFAQLRGRSSFR